MIRHWYAIRHIHAMCPCTYPHAHAVHAHIIAFPMPVQASLASTKRVGGHWLRMFGLSQLMSLDFPSVSSVSSKPPEGTAKETATAPFIPEWDALWACLEDVSA